MSLLKLKGLRKEFGGLVAVNDMDLELEEGEIRGLIGPNGSGKTTLFNLISGFLTPTMGEVIWKGQNITGKSVHRIVKKGITRTFQLTKLLKNRTALENVVIGRHLHVDALGLEKSKEEAHRLTRKALSALKPFRSKARRLDQIAHYLLDRDY